jgi:hypothetical protein
MVDGQRVDSLSGDGETATIEREGNFVVFVERTMADRTKELKISVGASDDKEIYIAAKGLGASDKFGIISRDEIGKYRGTTSRGQLLKGLLRFMALFFVGFFLLGLLAQCATR